MQQRRRWNCEEWGRGVRERGETVTEVAKFNCGEGGEGEAVVETNASQTVSTNRLLSTMEVPPVLYRINSDEMIFFEQQFTLYI